MPKDSDELTASYIRGLLEERRQVAQKHTWAPTDDLQNRLDGIDAELARVGYKAKAPAKRAERRPAPDRETR